MTKIKTKTHNIYVVALDRSVLKVRRFAQANPNHDPQKACLYVGMTGLTPDERYANHKRGYRASRYVRKYGMFLRRKLYEKYNPMTYEDAQKMEVELAQRLRAKGHAVWQK
jgi:hypothetical protein